MKRLLLLFILAGNSCYAASRSDNSVGSAAQRDLKFCAERILRSKTRTGHLFRRVNAFNIGTTHPPFTNTLSYIAERPGSRCCQSFTDRNGTGRIIEEGTLEIFHVYSSLVIITTHTIMSKACYEAHSDRWVGREEGDGIRTVVTNFAELPHTGVTGIVHRADVPLPLFKALLDLKKRREDLVPAGFAVVRDGTGFCVVS